jgi:hypothetical protein
MPPQALLVWASRSSWPAAADLGMHHLGINSRVAEIIGIGAAAGIAHLGINVYLARGGGSRHR